MTNSKSTKRALASSILATFMCIAMLVGMTFAWFTDTASTGVNKIQAGKLDVSLEMKENGEWVNAEGETLDFVKAEGHENEAILWEPGCTYELPQLRVVNKGNLKLKYKVVITGINGDAKLNEAIEWTFDGTGAGTLAAEANKEFTIKGHMRDNAGNEYQGLSIDGISITVYATQVEGEYDSYGNDYDKDATYPIEIVPDVNDVVMTAVKNGDDITGYTYTNGTVTVTTTGQVPETAPVVRIVKTRANGDAATAIKADGKEAIAYDISVKSGATNVPATIVIPVGKGLTGVEVYHEGTKMTSNKYSYDSVTGEITIHTTSYSVYTFAYNPYYAKNTVEVSNEKELRTALYEAANDGTQTTIILNDDITLEMLYAAENFGTTTIKDNAAGDTLNRYKKGVHPTAEDPTHWNPLVTSQTQEQKEAYGAYFHTGANDERIARLVVKKGQNVALDLNGHNLSKAARATHGDWSDVCTSLIGNYGTLSIIDSAGTGLITGSGMISCSGGVIHNYGGMLTINGVNIDGGADYTEAKTGQYVIVNGDTNGTIVLDGAHIYDGATSASLICNNAGTMTIKNETELNHVNTKVINCKGGKVFVESAKIKSNKYAVYAEGGTVTVTKAAVKIVGSGTMTEDGGKIIEK